MRIDATDSERNTLRAALTVHRDKVLDALHRARRGKDSEHVDMLNAELANVKAGLAAI